MKRKMFIYEAIIVHCMSHSHVGICLEEQHVLKGIKN